VIIDDPAAVPLGAEKYCSVLSNMIKKKISASDRSQLLLTQVLLCPYARVQMFFFSSAKKIRSESLYKPVLYSTDINSISTHLYRTLYRFTTNRADRKLN
jgi:hypothetical protein